MKICLECLDDFIESNGAQSKDGRALIADAEAMGFKFEVVPPEQCEDSSHEPIKSLEVKE